MIAVQLIAAKEYLPKLEEIGLSYKEIIVIEDIPHSVFETPTGRRMIYPGVSGDYDEIPMIPASSIDQLYEKARWVMRQEPIKSK